MKQYLAFRISSQYVFEVNINLSFQKRNYKSLDLFTWLLTQKTVESSSFSQLTESYMLGDELLCPCGKYGFKGHKGCHLAGRTPGVHLQKATRATG